MKDQARPTVPLGLAVAPGVEQGCSLFLTLYVLVLAALAVFAPSGVWRPETGAFLFVLGWIGVWRWSWGAIHLVRSIWYRAVVFPRWRAQADA